MSLEAMYRPTCVGAEKSTGKHMKYNKHVNLDIVIQFSGASLTCFLGGESEEEDEEEEIRQFRHGEWTISFVNMLYRCERVSENALTCMQKL